MSNELLDELPKEELAPPEYYPIKYALMWVAFGNEPINLDYARIIYDKPPHTISGDALKNAEKKLFAYLRSGKISAKSMDYRQNEEGKYVPTGKFNLLDRKIWKNSFYWGDEVLAYKNEDGQSFEHTDIVVKTADLINCRPIGQFKLIEKTSIINQEELVNDCYIPVYMKLMLKAVKTLNLSPDKRANMDDIIDWLNENWPPDLEGKSDRMIKSMATLLRRPEDKKGGNTSWK